MKTRKIQIVVSLTIAMLAAGAAVSRAAALSTAFTYQGQLNKDNSPVDGNCDLRFDLFDDETAADPSHQLGTQTVPKVDVRMGLFTVQLNAGLEFGPNAFTGADRWVEIAVRCPADPTNVASFSPPLAPREQITATPYSLYAPKAGRATGVDCSGCITASEIDISSILGVPWSGSPALCIPPGPNCIQSPLPILNATYTGANGTGLFGHADMGSTAIGVEGHSTQGTGVVGLGNTGVYGNSTGQNSEGVQGVANNGTNARGVDGSSTAGIGVHGKSDMGTGVIGESTAGTGVSGITASGDTGVYGESDELAGTGVEGVADSNGGNGVYGSSSHGTGVNGSNTEGGFGVQGTSITGIGVLAKSDGTSIDHPALFAWSINRNATAPAGIAIYALNESGDATIVAQNSGGGDVYRALNQAGNGFPFRVTNTGRVVTPAVEITGGGDLAEKFQVGGRLGVEPGTLLVIDDQNPGKLKRSHRAYDTRVAGVVSGAGGVNPGMTLEQHGAMDGDVTVAIAGRIYVKAEALSASINPGDLLTSSSLPGIAMKASNRVRAQGAIIGKAMSKLDRGTGLVLTLVNLQ